MGELDWRMQDALRSLLGRARRGKSDPREVLKEATGWLDRRVVNRLVDELHGGVEQLQEVWFGHDGIQHFPRTPAAAVAALAWVRSAERLLEAGADQGDLGNRVVLFAARDEAGSVTNG